MPTKKKVASASQRKPVKKAVPVIVKPAEPVMASVQPADPASHCEPPKTEAKQCRSLKPAHLVVAVLVICIMVLSASIFKAIAIMGTQATMIRLMQ